MNVSRVSGTHSAGPPSASASSSWMSIELTVTPFRGYSAGKVWHAKAEASRETARLAELLKIEAQRPDPDGGPARADEPTSGTAANT